MDPEEITIPVAAYVRAAPTDGHPLEGRPGIARQRDAIDTFAASHCMTLVRRFQDITAATAAAGARPALEALVAAAGSAACDFEFVLVHDATRLDLNHSGDWQARDAGLRAAGIVPLYVTEPERNDGALIGRRLKQLMAQERRASMGVLVAAAKRRFAAQGFHQGGLAPYGYRRKLIGWSGDGRVMGRGEGRSSGRYRSVLVPGSEQEVQTVRRIYRMYVMFGRSAGQIAARLNREGVPAGLGRPWREARVIGMLQNEIYTGVRRMGRKVRTASGRRSLRPDAEVLRIEDACEPIITRGLFEAAQARRGEARRRFTEAEILDGLRALLKANGVITRDLIERDPELPGVAVVAKRFGGVAAAYAMIGYAPPSEVERRAAMKRMRLESRL